MDPIVGKPGYLTTEFWLSLAGVVSTFLIAIFGKDWGVAHDAQAVASIAPALVAGLYALGRSILKGNTHLAISNQNAATLQNGNVLTTTSDLSR